MVKIGAMYMGGPFTPKTFGQRAEAAGFDSLWAGDHVLHYVDGLTTLGCFAGCTDHIELGTAVIVAPFRPAAVVAKGLMTAAFIAGRQIMAGIGPGGDVAREFDVTGATISERGAYTDEALDVISRLWTGEPVTYDGRWNRFAKATLLAAPVPGGGAELVPRPAIWIGGRSEASLRRTVRFGSGYIPYLISPAQLKDRVGRLRELAEKAGRDPDEIAIACCSFLVPAASTKSAIEIGLPKVGFNFITAENMAEFYVLGSKSECVDKIGEYIEAGATHVVLGCHPGPEHQLDAYFEAMSEIMPAVRAR